MSLLLESVKHDIEGTCPQPIAAAFHRYRAAPKKDLGGRHKMLVDVVEVFLKFACILQLQDGIQGVQGLADRLHQSLEILKRPSLGQWLSVLRSLSAVDFGTAPVPWARAVAEWFLRPGDRNGLEALRLARQLLGDGTVPGVPPFLVRVIC